MKALLLSAVIAMIVCTPKSYASEDQTFVATAYNVDCLDKNGNPTTQIEQGRIAIHDMLISAETTCGKDKLPIQVGATTIESAHSCFHYSLGAIARARFKCGDFEAE